MKKITTSLVTILLTVFALPAFADEENYIKYRQYVMKSLSANLKASAMILKAVILIIGLLPPTLLKS